MPALLCDRPHTRFVDYETSRFVVTTCKGLTVPSGRLEFGDEVPAGALSPDALRQEYEPPLRRIDLIEFAMRDPIFREACARRGVTLEDEPEQPDSKPPSTVSENEQEPTVESSSQKLDFDSMKRGALRDFCRLRGINDKGSTGQIRERLRTLLG